MRLLRWQLMRCPQASDSLTYHRLEIEKKNPPMCIEEFLDTITMIHMETNTWRQMG